MDHNKGQQQIDWQISRKEISQRAQYLLETGQWSDCRFLVGEEPNQQILEGHKLFLAIASPVFEAMFFGNMAEKNDPIPILDVQPDAFKALLNYIYTDTVTITSFEKACELCYGAKKYMLPHLVEKCTKYMWADLHSQNAVRAYEFAKLFEEPVLMEKCMQIICSKTDEVLNSTKFEEIELQTMVTIFEQDYLNIDSELDLFEAAARYAQKYAENQEENVRAPQFREAIQKIRFLTLTPQQFAEGPGRSNLFTQAEAFAILMNISSPLTDSPMPEGFSMVTQCRLKYPSLTMAPQKEFGGRDGVGEIPPRESLSRSLCPIPLSPVMSSSNTTYENRPPRDQNKYICTRAIVQQTECLNTSVLDCSVTFTVDKNICVTGVQVPTQVEVAENNMPQPPPIFPATTYTDVLYAHLLDSDGSRLTYTHYSARVSYRSIQEISFNRPVYIQRNKVYKVGVVFNKVGWYPMGACTQRLSADSVMFNFCVGQASDSVRDGLIRAIVFG